MFLHEFHSHLQMSAIVGILKQFWFIVFSFHFPLSLLEEPVKEKCSTLCKPYGGFASNSCRLWKIWT